MKNSRRNVLFFIGGIICLMLLGMYVLFLNVSFTKELYMSVLVLLLLFFVALFVCFCLYVSKILYTMKLLQLKTKELEEQNIQLKTELDFSENEYRRLYNKLHRARRDDPEIQKILNESKSL